MSKLYEKYSQLKRLDSSKYYLFQSGIFYIFIDQDAIFMSSALNLKLTHLNNEILKCGFPVQNLSKYTSIFNSLGYTVEIVSNKTDTVYKASDFILNNDVKTFLSELSNLNPNSLSVGDAYACLENIQSRASALLTDK